MTRHFFKTEYKIYFFLIYVLVVLLYFRKIPEEWSYKKKEFKLKELKLKNLTADGYSFYNDSLVNAFKDLDFIYLDDFFESNPN